MGMTAVLHTWARPWCVTFTCTAWSPAEHSPPGAYPARSTYLFPVRALSRHVRCRFVSRLRRAFEAGQLPRIRDRAEVDRTLQALMGTEWVVYSKPCLAASQTVVDYLGRYSHRIALSDSRILDFEDGEVSLSYKDYRDGDRRKVMTLSAGAATPLPAPCASHWLHVGQALWVPGQPLSGPAPGADPHSSGRAAP